MIYNCFFYNEAIQILFGEGEENVKQELAQKDFRLYNSWLPLLMAHEYTCVAANLIPTLDGL